MDLSTLDTLLKSHVSQLEKLYTQLGAPADSVPTKLQELHNALVGTVQRQREAAENEVKLVEDSIQALEATIARKRFQLSGDIADKDPTAIRASTTANVTSETLLQKQERLEKEDVALERDVQLREKQIVHVLNQLEEYRPVLGDFLDLDEKGSLVARTEDLSLARLQALEAKVTRCKEEIVRALLLDCYCLDMYRM